MSKTLLVFLILTLPKLVPTLIYIEPIYKTCGDALNKRLIRVCKNEPSGSNSQTLTTSTNYTYSSNYTNYAGRNGTKALRSLFADCCNSARGCSDVWIHKRYCLPTSTSKRDASQVSLWNEAPLHNQEEYSCFQQDAFYYNWWSEHEGGILVEEMKATDPADCHQLCNKFNDCRFWSFSNYRTPYEPRQNCILKKESGGGYSRLILSASGPDDCIKQEEFRWFGPVDSCIELANNNSEFLQKPRAYFAPMIIPFNARLSDPKQFNLLQIKLHIQKTFTLYIAPAISVDYHDKVIVDSPDVKKMFKNAYTIDVRQTNSPFKRGTIAQIVINHMTDGDWSDEETYIIQDRIDSWFLMDEFHIRFLPDAIMTYLVTNSEDGKSNRYYSAKLSRPAWLETVENIWFTADDKSLINNFFHCTSGLAIPRDFDFTYNYQLDFKPQMSVGYHPWPSNYVVFFGQIKGKSGDQILFEFLTSGAPNYDSLFTLFVRFWDNDEHISFNSRENGVYGDEIKFYNFPFYTYKNDSIKLNRVDFMFLSNRVNVAIDGTIFGSFNYRGYQHTHVVAARTSFSNYMDKRGPKYSRGENLFKLIGVDVKWISIVE